MSKMWFVELNYLDIETLPYRLPLCKWGKHVPISLVIPGHDPPLERTIFMDINPGPVFKFSTQRSCEDRSASDLHILPKKTITYSRSQLFAIRRLGCSVRSHLVLHSLKKCALLRFRGSRGGTRRIPCSYISVERHSFIHPPLRVLMNGNEFFPLYS